MPNAMEPNCPGMADINHENKKFRKHETFSFLFFVFLNFRAFVIFFQPILFLSFKGQLFYYHKGHEVHGVLSKIC